MIHAVSFLHKIIPYGRTILCLQYFKLFPFPITDQIHRIAGNAAGRIPVTVVPDWYIGAGVVVNR